MPKGQKGINKMKKNIFKKIVASLATVAMAAGLFTAMPAEEAKAAAPAYVYLVGSFNGWNNGEAPAMTGSGNTWTKTLTVTEAGAVEFKLLVDSTAWDNANNAEAVGELVNVTNAGGNDKNMKVVCPSTGELKIDATFDDAGNVTQVKASGAELQGELPDEYFVVGDEGLCSPAWDTDNFAGAKQLEETSAGVWSYTIKNVQPKDGKATTYNYNVLHQKGWANKLANSSVEVVVKSDVTFTYTKSTGEVKVTVTPLEKLPDNKTPDNKTPEKKNEVTVEVTLDPSLKWDEVYVHAWGDNFSTKWPGVKMTAKNGKYYATIDTKLTKLSYVISAGDGKDQTIDIADVNGQDVKITVTAKKDAEGKKFVATAAGAKGAANTGDVAPVVVMLVVAMAAASVVVASKKKTICE